MTQRQQKLMYLLSSVVGSANRSRSACPSCGRFEGEIVERKMLVTRLVRCRACKLLYRIPTDKAAHRDSFYQHAYQSGFTTDCPSPEALQALVATGFRGSAKDFSGRIAFITALGVKPGARVLDFGASWGYGTWQFQQAGFDVTGFEVARERARYARDMLRVPVEDALEKITGPYDLFFSSHVLEHVPNPRETIRHALTLLRHGGLFLAFTPNGSRTRMAAAPQSYRKHWGRLHPQFLDEEFYEATVPNRPKLLCSDPYDLDEIRRWSRRTSVRLPLGGDELCAAIAM